jgi:hypothetical protein
LSEVTSTWSEERWWHIGHESPSHRKLELK